VNYTKLRFEARRNASALRPQCFRLLALVTAAFFLSRAASAGAPAASCVRPFVFPEAAVNFVVLPFTNSVSQDAPLSRAATHLTLMIQTDTIFSILKYGSVGAVRLVARPGEQKECQPEIVAAKLLGQRPGATQIVRPGYGLILFWGRLFEENHEIYLQSFARFLRRGVSENLSLSIDETQFQGRLFNGAVAFAPQRLTPTDLSEIENEFNQYAVVHNAPQEDSPGSRLPLDLSPFDQVGFVYTVGEVRGDWMRIVARGRGPNGWIHAGSDTGPFRATQMPELNFVDGITGYLSYRAAKDGDAPDTTLRTVSWAENALRKYEEAGDPKRAPVALAVAKTVHGLLEIVGPLGADSKTKTALQLFQDASDLVPYNGDARNLELITRWYLYYRGYVPELRVPLVWDGFLQAAVLAPDNPTILKNLEHCYELLLQKGPPPGSSSFPEGFNKEQIEQKLAALRLVQSSAPQ
jgi:hypothetical protein